MKNLKIFICGNFGYKNNQIDGQTIKTRQLKDVMIKKIGRDSIVYVDTSYAKRKPIFTFNEIKKNIKNSNHLIILPGSNGLRVLLPLFIRWKKKLKIDIRYVVIGGWLPDFLKKKKKYLSLCKKIDKIYVETKFMKQKLIEIGLQNVDILTNFRQFNFTRKSINKVKGSLKLVYFSRVLKEKGIELAMESVNRINKKYDKKVVEFDIYGPINSKYKKEFEKQIVKSEEYICYKGFLEPDNIYKKLSKYDLMIFPTFCKTECFPGAIIDSYISGVPVLASNWQYSDEIIKENITGKLFASQDIGDLTKKLEFMINNPDLIYKMKQNCLEEAKKYNADFVLDSLIKDIILK
jgi:glycosyltransferase involved in cell wall biosynthesis